MGKNNEEKYSICKTHLKTLIRDRLRERGIKLTAIQVSLIVDELFDTMEDELLKGNSILIRGFGSFSVFNIKRFLARHPQDKTEFYYRKAQKRISFKMGRTLKDRLNDE